MIKMVVLDIDGTILGKTFKISERTKKCFDRLMKSGVKIVLATGRMYYATIHIAKELNLHDPIITYQGAYIREIIGKNNVLRDVSVPADIAKEVIKTIKRNNIHINIYANDTLFVENDGDIIKHYCVDRKIPYKVVSDLLALDYPSYHKVLAIDNDTQKITDLIELLQEKFSDKLHITRSTPHYCEVSNLCATKGDCVAFLAQKWGIKKEEIIAIGDQENDIEMLLAAGIKVAMGNATQRLKDIADFVTLDVEKDGACYAIEKFVEAGEKIEF